MKVVNIHSLISLLVIYTDTINPSIDTDFIWFNGLELIDADHYKDNNDIDNIDGYIQKC